MKNHYCLLLVGLLLVASEGMGQAPNPVPVNPESPAIQGKKRTAPFLGITVNIPLWKIFGKKREKALPEAPKLDGESYYAEQGLPFGPPPMSSETESDTTAVTVTPTVSDEEMYDLEEVTVTAPRLKTSEIPVDPRGNFGGINPPAVNGGGSNGGGGGGSTAPPPPPSPSEDPIAKCKECKRLQYKKAYELKLTAKAALVATMAYGCTKMTFGTFVTINEGGAWAAFIPGGAQVLEAVAAGGALVVEIGCLVSAAWTYHLAVTLIEADLATGLMDCGSCPYP